MRESCKVSEVLAGACLIGRPVSALRALIGFNTRVFGWGHGQGNYTVPGMTSGQPSDRREDPKENRSGAKIHTGLPVRRSKLIGISSRLFVLFPFPFNRLGHLFRS
jgi:hypothetical protein